jgi:hypothetical protein
MTRKQMRKKHGDGVHDATHDLHDRHPSNLYPTSEVEISLRMVLSATMIDA